MVLQFGWRPTAIAANSLRTASRVLFDLQVDLPMALALRAYCREELPAKLVADYLGTVDRGSRKFRVLNRENGFHLFGRKPTVWVWKRKPPGKQKYGSRG
jgi:hypothetical protein